MEFRRQTLAGTPIQASSAWSQGLVVPTGGFTNQPDVLATPDSVVSGQNVWVQIGVFKAREKLSQVSVVNPVVAGCSDHTVNKSDSYNSVILGGFTYTDAINGVIYPIVGTRHNFFVGQSTSLPNSQTSWSALSYVSSTGSSLIPQLHERGDWFSATVLSASRGTSLAVIVGQAAQPNTSNGSNVAYCYWTTGTVQTTYSHLTGAPGARDVACFANRPVMWHVADIAQNHYPQRVQWSVAGEPEDWTGIGSGFQDLADARGFGTRIFAQNDQLVIATDQELWRGREVGLPYVFQFSPINRAVGIPFPRAAMQTPLGIVWLGDDFMLRRLVGESIEEIGQPFQDLLRRTLLDPQTAFLSYNPMSRQLRLWYCSTDRAAGSGQNPYPDRSVTIHLQDRTWTLEHYPLVFHRALDDNLPWLGRAGSPIFHNVPELLFTSAGSGCAFHTSATSDLGGATTEDAVFGTLQASDLRHMKLCDEVRLDLAAFSASSLSYSLSTDNGTSYSFQTKLAVSAASNSSQMLLYPKIAGNYFTTRLQSTNGTWELRRYFSRFMPDGEAR